MGCLDLLDSYHLTNTTILLSLTDLPCGNDFHSFDSYIYDFYHQCCYEYHLEGMWSEA